MHTYTYFPPLTLHFCTHTIIIRCNSIKMLVSGTPFVATPYAKIHYACHKAYETIGVTNMITRNDEEFLNLSYNLATNSSFRRNETSSLESC